MSDPANVCFIAAVGQGGGLYLGATMNARSETMIWFNDPETKSTLVMPAAEIHSSDDIRRHIAESRAKFGVANAAQG